MRKLFNCAVLALALPVAAQQQAGASTLYLGTVCTLGCYGHNARNQNSGTGDNMANGFGNYGTVGVGVPPAATNTPIASGLLAVGANAERSFGGAFRATTYRSGGYNIGLAAWALNSSGGSPSGTVVGGYFALSDMPTSKAALDAELEPAALIADNKAQAAPVLVARQNGVTAMSVPYGGQLRLHDLGTAKPACDAGTAGAFWYEAGGSGVADTLEACTKDAADAYAWRSLP